MSYISIKNANKNNLKNISIDIPLNKYVVFVGKSGSGKSTLVVDVVVEGFYKNQTNVQVPIEPLLFKQKAFVHNSAQTIKKYLGVAGDNLIYAIENKYKNNNIKKMLLLNICKKMNIELLKTSKKICELNISTYNKIRFLKLILNYDNTLIIVDELGAGLSVLECDLIADCFELLVAHGYSLLIVEHALPIIRKAEYIIELGPEAGNKGGEITFSGTFKEYTKTKNWSGMINVLKTKKSKPYKSGRMLSVDNINYCNLSSVNISVPLYNLVTICGDSGSGKSSLLDIIYRACDKTSNAWKNRQGIIGTVEGKNNLRRPYFINQTPLSNNSMSTPATYTGIMNSIRNMFENEAIINNFKFNKGDFSYNSSGGCKKCGGKGSFEIVLNDETVYEYCELCKGLRFEQNSLLVKESGLSIGEVLNCSCEELYKLYCGDKKKKVLSSKINFINNIGLSYLKLGQPSGSLSGGESQRIKITKELSKKLGDRCLFILDSPAKGLHMLDLPLVMNSLRKLVDKKNSVVIAENNPYFINNSDWMIFMQDGKIVYEGVPKNCPNNLNKKIQWE